jgi:hypothetical protein
VPSRDGVVSAGSHDVVEGLKKGVMDGKCFRP